MSDKKELTGEKFYDMKANVYKLDDRLPKDSWNRESCDLLVPALDLIKDKYKITLKRGDIVIFNKYNYIFLYFVEYYGYSIYDGKNLKPITWNSFGIVRNTLEFNVLDSFPLNYWVDVFKNYLFNFDLSSYGDELYQNMQFDLTSGGKPKIFTSFVMKDHQTVTDKQVTKSHETVDIKKNTSSDDAVKKNTSSDDVTENKYFVFSDAFTCTHEYDRDYDSDNFVKFPEICINCAFGHRDRFKKDELEEILKKDFLKTLMVQNQMFTLEPINIRQSDFKNVFYVQSSSSLT